MAKTKLVADYVDVVQEKFPFLTKSEINHILTYGLRLYAWVNRMHADVLFMTNYGDHYVAHTGYLGFDVLKHYLRWLLKWRMKERVLYRLKKKKWDGYYYIGLYANQIPDIEKLRGKFKTFRFVYLTKIKLELYHNKSIKQIWRVPWTMDCGWKFFVENLRTDKAEYIGENQYTKYHTCFLGKYNKDESGE